MIIEVLGIGIPNKGAELMLVAIQTEIRKKYPDAKFVVEPSADYLGRARHGLYQKFWMSFKGVQLGFLGALLPKKIRQRFGIVLDRDVDVILDASGFAYGDQWGAAKAHNRLGKYILGWKKQNKKVIVMPQALGPFTDKKLAAEMQLIVGNADLVFARDTRSLAYIKEIADNNVFLAPDFTNICSGHLAQDIDPQDLDICFIANAKMIEMTASETGGSYVRSMASLLNLCQKQGREPFLLVHEGRGDREIAEQINKLLDKPVAILAFNSPLEIKALIGAANLVVSSRFHGLVSALSQGIPCIATGWSHKYQMLMQDYGCAEFLVKHDTPQAEEQLFALLDKPVYLETRKKIEQHALEQKALSKKMWQQVFACIDA